MVGVTVPNMQLFTDKEIHRKLTRGGVDAINYQLVKSILAGYISPGNPMMTTFVTSTTMPVNSDVLLDEIDSELRAFKASGELRNVRELSICRKWVDKDFRTD